MMRKNSDTCFNGQRRIAGFTLIELMIAMAVVGILAAIAYPLYEHQIEESRRTEARTALTELAAREQRYFATNNAYTSNAGFLGYGSNNWPIAVGGGYYELAKPNVQNSNTPPYFLLTATAIGTQTADSACQTFTVDSTGAEVSYDSSSKLSTSTCW